MINTALKTHWRLAFKYTLKAVKVTLQVLVQMIRAQHYRFRISEKLLKQRRVIEKLEQEAVDKFVNRLS